MREGLLDRLTPEQREQFASGLSSPDDVRLFRAWSGSLADEKALIAAYRAAPISVRRERLARELVLAGTPGTLAALALDLRSGQVYPQLGEDQSGCWPTARGIALDALALAHPDSPILNQELGRFRYALQGSGPTVEMVLRQEELLDRVEDFVRREHGVTWPVPRPRIGLCVEGNETAWAAAFGAAAEPGPATPAKGTP